MDGGIVSHSRAHRADAGEARQEARILLRVPGREGADLRGRPRRVVPQDERAAVEHRRAGVRIRTDDAQAVALEAERAHEGGIDRRRMRERRAAEAGGELGRPRAAARALAALEDEHLPPAFREERRGHQTVHAAADHDHVHRHHHETRETGTHVGTKHTKVIFFVIFVPIPAFVYFVVIMPAVREYAGPRCGLARP